MAAVAVFPALLPGSSAAGACPDAGPCVIVDVVGTVSAHQVFSVSDLATLQDLDHPPYQVRSVPGGATQDEPRPEKAVSVQRLLSAVEVAPGSTLPWQSITFAEVFDRNGGSHPLTGTELANAGANGFVDNLMPGLFIGGANDAVAYIRPLRPDPNDVNGTDFFQTFSHDALHITAHTSGTVLHPTVVPAKTQAAVGEGIAFSVSWPQPPTGNLTYAWSFGDGSGAADPAPTHAWGADGTYYVSVSVRSDDGSVGQSAAVPIQVGNPSSPTASPTAPGGGGGGSPTNLPTGPETGTGKPTAKPTKTPTKSPSTSPTHTATGSPTATATSPSSGAALPSTVGTPTAAATTAPPATHSPRATPTPTTTTTAPTDDGGVEVAGQLLAADADVVVVPDSSTYPGALDPSAGRPRPPLGGAVAWWVLTLPLLLLAGAASELLPLLRRSRRDATDAQAPESTR